MVESGHLFPGVLTVATSALGAELGFVGIRMARYALRDQPEKLARLPMALLTSKSGVLAREGIPRLLVVEAGAIQPRQIVIATLVLGVATDTTLVSSIAGMETGSGIDAGLECLVAVQTPTVARPLVEQLVALRAGQGSIESLVGAAQWTGRELRKRGDSEDRHHGEEPRDQDAPTVPDGHYPRFLHKHRAIMDWHAESVN
jgi:hypothetical protein